MFYLYLFYSMVIMTMLYFAIIEYNKGYALGWSLVIINAVAVIIYIIFPVSTYWWRQAFLANLMTNNFWDVQVYNVWASDTSFNCFPSLHAAVSTICFFTWYQYSKTKPSSITKLTAATVLIVAGGAVLSTLFVKQHYIADEIAGIALALLVGRLVFKRLWKS
jgi:membrane-associated phospholipid phosphatase